MIKRNSHSLHSTARRHAIAALAVFCLLSLRAAPAAAQQSNDRDPTWGTVTLVTALSAAGIEFFMPRVADSLPERTLGWKARWHATVMLPAAVSGGLAALNEYWLRPDVFQSPRPGCDDTGGSECFGLFSTPTFGSFAALGQGTSVFLVDTLSNSDGRINVGSLVGHVVLPGVLSAVTAVGRGVGRWETTEQVLGSAGTGLAVGLLVGFAYASWQPPECGYTGALLCW